MIVLALDTTTPRNSCALLRDGRVHERPGDARLSHAARLPRDLMLLLEAEGISLAEVDAFGVATGPGSFTGLRIGIATMQGLAFAGGTPLVGVSALDALASIAATHLWIAGHDSARDGDRPRTATWVDAWRGEVYTALYEGTRLVEEPSVEPPAQVLQRLAGTRVVFAGDGAATYAERIGEALGVTGTILDPAAPLLAGTIAWLTGRAVESGDRPPPDAIRPLYVRRPDAELAREARAVP